MTVPTRVPGGGETWTRLALGEAHLCGVDEAGALWCAGTNGSGQVGDGAGGSRLTPTQVPGEWYSLVVGSNSVCARSFPDGTLSCWGQNSAAQLGDGTSFGREVPTRITSGQLDDPFTVAETHGCSTRTRHPHHAHLLGANSRGQLGTGTVDAGHPLPQATMPAITIASEIVAGTHTCARGSE